MQVAARTRGDLDELRDQARSRAADQARDLLAQAAAVGLSTSFRDLAGPPGAIGEQLHFQVADQTPEVGDVYPLSSAIATLIVTAADRTSGERVAYLKASYTTDQLAAATFPTGLHFGPSRGWGLNFDDPAQLWVSAHVHAKSTPRSLTGRGVRVMSLTTDDAPDPTTLAADLAVLEAAQRPAMARWVAYFKVPFVAYARIQAPSWRRRGLGPVLYDLCGRELARTGRVLRASALQTSDAQSLWARLVADESIPTGSIELPSLSGSDAPTCHLTIDHRGSSSGPASS